MSGIFVNRGMMKLEERAKAQIEDLEVSVSWYTGQNMQNRDFRKFVEVIYRNFEEIAEVTVLRHNRTEIKKIMTSPTALILVATLSDRIIGYLIADLVLYNDRSLMHVYYLFTSPGYRNKGVATFLLNQVQDYAEVYNCSALSLTFDTYNDQLNKYYTSNGFTFDPELRSEQRYDMMVKFI